MTRRAEIRVYPACCTSACCGRADCFKPTPCRNLPVKQAFDNWVKDHAAVVTDPIWCPNVYEATR